MTPADPSTSKSHRPFLVAANWKMNLLRADAEAWCRHLRREATGSDDGNLAALVFPSHPLLIPVAAALAAEDGGGDGDGEGDGALPIEVGGQDLHPEASGAHTGDVSGDQLVDAGCTWVLVGHSERRNDHGESDGLVAAKVAAARAAGLVPLVCVGESAAERASGETFEVLRRQAEVALRALDAALKDEALDDDDPTPGRTGGPERRPSRHLPFALAYEPVWAIGTGDTATSETVQEAHAFLRESLGEIVSPARAEATPILYGGSVKPHNAADLAAVADVDGFLVGGASLDAGSFLDIIGACRR